MPVPVAHDAAGAHLGDGGPRLQISPRADDQRGHYGGQQISGASGMICWVADEAALSVLWKHWGSRNLTCGG